MQSTLLEWLLFILETISVIAVILSLIYVARQIRQNTEAMRDQAERDVTLALQQFSTFFIYDKEITQIFIAGLQDAETLSPEDFMRFNALLSYLFSSFETALTYHRRGMFNDEDQERYVQTILELMKNPGTQFWWQQSKAIYSQDVHQVVQRGLEN
jgi:hypothetical protein